MKRATFITAVTVVLLAGSSTQAGVSLIMNGSFEDDGIINDITLKTPRKWCDVNVPSDKFLGWISTDWKTHGNYSLSLYSGFASFAFGDMATVSQQVYLADVNKIIFDLSLGAIAGYPWDPSKRSALLLIDGDVIWDSGDHVPNANSEYLNQMVDVDEIYKDANSHRLSLALRADVTGMEWFFQYLARWDFVKFDTHCGGFGYLPGDLNQDCYVDMLDMKVLAEHWLEPVILLLSDVSDDGVVNFKDFAVFTDRWASNSNWENWQDDNCFEVKLLAADLNDDGIVNLCDFAILTCNWMSEDTCIRADIDGSGIVDYGDISKLADEWLLKSWLYGLE